MKEETLKRYVGKQFGVITVLGVDHETYDKEKQMKNKYTLDLFLDRVSKIYNLHCNKSSTTISKESTS